MRNPKSNEFDIRNKLRRYEEALKGVGERVRKLDVRVIEGQKKELMSERTLTPGERSHLERMN